MTERDKARIQIALAELSEALRRLQSTEIPEITPIYDKIDQAHTELEELLRVFDQI